MAATRRQSVLPGLEPLRERETIRFSFMLIGPSRRVDAAPAAADCIDHVQLQSLNHANRHDPLFTIVPTTVDLLQDRPLEYPYGILEVDTMLGEIGRVFGGIPFKCHLCMYELY